jgi:uncharacterized protein (UPF0332 family)
MKQHKDLLIKNAFEKADEALISAKLNIDNNLLTAAQNRIYYAVFYSVVGLGYSEDYITSKHSQLLGWFNKKFIHENKIFNKNMFRIYKEAYENRTKSDYQFSWKPNKQDMLKDLQEVEAFVKTVKEHIYN